MKRKIVSAVSVGLFLLTGCPDGTDNPAPTYTLSGTVTRAWGGPLAGVTITLGGGSTASAVTDASGKYAFANLSNGSYMMMPALAGYVFAPEMPTFTLSADRTQDFVADGAYTISGTVSGSVQGGVSIALSGGGVVKPAAVSATGTGAYAFAGIPNGTYTLTPTLAGHTFTPAAPSVVVANADATQDFTGSALLAIGGKVLDGLGAGMAGITVRLGGASTAIRTTDASGSFTFGGLARGRSYTVTPATFGYAFGPPERTYPLNADVTTADFTGSPYGPGTYTYDGTLSYSGTKSGPVYVTVSASFSNGSPAGGTGLVSQQGPWADRAFSVRNAQAGGPVVIRAWMDTLGSGRFNAGADPSVTFTATATGSPFDLGDHALVDPSPAPTVASPLSVNAVVPCDGTALVVYDVPRDANGEALADGYRVYWNDGPLVDSSHTLGTVDVPAGPDFALVHGLTNGTGYWFRVEAYLGGVLLPGQSAATASAVAPGPTTGTATVSGTVTHPTVATPSALYVIAAAGKGDPSGGVHLQRIANPSGAQTGYSLSVPPGSYQLFAFIDDGDDGAISLGEPALFPSGSSRPAVILAAGANAGPTIAIPTGSASASLKTSRWANQFSTWTNLVIDLASNAKFPLSAVLTGPGLRGPVDLGMSREGGGSGFDLGEFIQTAPILPFVGDTYDLAVTYTDGTTESFQRTVTGVFGGPPGLVAPADGAAGVATVPTFRWTPPTGAPGAFGYGLQVWPSSGGDSVWETFMPGTQTSVTFDADGTAAAPRLSAFTAYQWIIRATDDHGNDASYQAMFTTGAAVLPSWDPIAGTTLDGALWQTPQFTRSVSGGKAQLSVRADHMEARTAQGTTYTNAVAVLPGAGNRVTALRAKVTVPAASVARTGTAVLLGGLRLLYQPSANRGFPFPTGNMNILNASLEVFDDGSGPRIRRRFYHCDDDACVALGNAGITAVDPPEFTASGVNALAAAAYDTPYTFEISLDETTGVFTWSVNGDGFASASGTANVSTWASGVEMALGTGFLSAQLFSRVADDAGGGSAAVAPDFDDVSVGLNRNPATPWDDFDTMGSVTTFSPARWGPVDSDVFVAGESLHLRSALTTAAAGGGAEATTAPLMYPTAFAAWQASVAIVADSPAAVPQSASGVAMIGAFYNDGAPGGGPGSALGDVRARVVLQAGAASYSLLRCNNAACTATTLSLGPTMLTPSPAHPLGVGTVHTLLVSWDPALALFTFQLDDAGPVQLDPTSFAPVSTPTPNYPFHAFQTSVSIGATAPAGTSASVEATIDDVRGAVP